MKTLFTILAFTLVFGAFAQEVKTIKIEEQKPECILWPLEIKPIPVVFDVDEFYRGQLTFPYWDAINPFGNRAGERYHLNKDLPFVQVLTTGSIYTFDHLRYTVR